MMSSQENLAARLKTGAKLTACIGHHQHHPGAMAAASRARAKQRKWRVLVSIGLLLPALAAIIGIVAWAISIEVANSDPTRGAGRPSPTSLAQRRAERLEQQQQRHEEALLVAANLAAMRRSARSQQEKSVNTINQVAPAQPAAQQVQQASQATEANSGRPKPVAAAIVAPVAPQQQQPQQVTTKRRAVAADQSPRQPQPQPNQQPQTENATTKTKSESALQEMTTAEDVPSSGSEEPQATQNVDPEGQQPPMTTTTSTTESQPEVETTPTPTSEAGQTDEEQQEKLELVEKPKHKSRWMNYDRANKSKSPMSGSSMQQSRDTVDPVPKKQTKSVKEILENLRASSTNKLTGQTKTSSLMSNRYTLLNSGDSKSSEANEEEHKRPGGDDAAQMSARQLQEESMVAVAKQAVKMMKKSKLAKQREQQPTVVVVSPTEQDQPENQDDQPASTAIEEKPQGGNSGGGGGDDVDDDEDLSFEAIASAISTTLSHQSGGAAKTSDRSSLVPPEALAASNQESVDEADQFGPTIDEQQQQRPNKARRTPGEHVAEVIDHLVDRRKQQQELSEHHRPLGGPQIVVVAPVGSSSLVKSARSLTKSDDTKVAPNKPTQMNKKSSDEPTKKVREQSKSTKPIGGRLLGTQDAASSNAPGKFSERVEVIEDDDSSALLMKNSPSGSSDQEQDRDETTADNEDQEEPTSSSSDAFAVMGDDFANMHVSSNAGEPRLRSPRHEMSASQSFERYAPIQQQQQQQHYNHHHLQQVKQQQQQSAKLYSAEQLIREAVLKSKSRPHQHQQQQQEQPIKQVEATEQQPQSKKNDEPQPTTTAATTSTTTQASSAKIPSTTSSTNEPRPTTETSPAQGLKREQSKASRQQQEPQIQPAESQQYGIQSVQVPMFTRQHSQFVDQIRPQQSYQHHRHHEQQQHQGQSIDTYQPMESQQQSQQVARPSRIALNNQQQAQVHQQLPVFADQEFNVPAHMAESVISQIQQSPSTVTGLLNGKSALFQAHAPGQVPSQQQPFNYAANHHHHHQQLMQMPHSGQHMAVASSIREPHVYMQHPQHQPLVQHWTQQQAAFAADLMARMAANRRHQLEQQLQSRQMMANRNGGSSGSEESAKGEKQETSGKRSILSSVSKVLRPRNLVQPMAEKAFNHLLSSFGQQAAAQQAEIESSSATEEDEQRSSASQPASAPSVSSASAAAAAVAAPPAGAASSQLATATSAAINNQQAMETLQGSASAPIASAALPPVGGQLLQTAADSSSSRAMRSLPIGASAPALPPQVAISDQEVQESYGQMPTYQMAGGDHYGGGGGHNYHQPDHDKKSKGITFHFGGGPIGGGTQLITSPMGIFRHLMIPLLPNPRVNLNGKVVFGVVLEKNTAFGSPPKKKHKFWGR